MFRVPKHIYDQRLSTCGACKHFRKATGSCGTLLLGNTLSEEEAKAIDKANTVTRHKSKYKLCGCVMRIKARLHWAKCPLGYWGAHGIDEKRREELRKFVRQIKLNGRLEHADTQRLYAIRAEITGRNEQISNCAPCVKSALNELEEYLNS